MTTTNSIKIALSTSLVASLLLLNSAVFAMELTPLDPAKAETVSFRKEVWPILKRHCWGCHSGGDPKGELSMDTVAEMLKGGETGPMFGPGKPDQSLLVEQIIGVEPAMPPEKAPLSQAKVDILRHWILGGAKDDSVAGEYKVTIPETYKYAPAINSLAFSTDGKRVAAACRSEVVLVDAEGDEPPQRLPTNCDLISHVEFSPNGELLVAAGGSPARFGGVTFFKASDGSVVNTREIGHDTFFRGNFSPDGLTLALGGADGAIHLVPIDPNSPPQRFELHSDWVFDVAYTPDGKMLVSGGRDKATKVCSVETGELLRSVDSSTEWISSVAADEQFGIGGGRAKTVTGYELKIALQNVQVTGAGNGAKPISRRAQYVKAFESQPGEVIDMVTSGDRKSIAIGGAYGDVRVYTIADRKRTALVSGVPNPVFSLALNNDATRLAVGGKNGEVRIYKLPEAELLKTIVPVPVADPK
jgi:WD40 repeat protein